jgi:hypothetical protein
MDNTLTFDLSNSTSKTSSAQHHASECASRGRLLSYIPQFDTWNHARNLPSLLSPCCKCFTFFKPTFTSGQRPNSHYKWVAEPNTTVCNHLSRFGKRRLEDFSLPLVPHKVLAVTMTMVGCVFGAMWTVTGY